MGFLWGSAAVSLSCGVSVGLAEALTGLADPARVPKSRRLPDPNDHFPVTQYRQGDLAGCSNSAPIADSARRADVSVTPESIRRLSGSACVMPSGP